MARRVPRLFVWGVAIGALALAPLLPTAVLGQRPLAVAVLGVERDTSLGKPYPVPADGVFYVVTLAVGEGRGFDSVVVEAHGRRYRRAHDVERLLPPAEAGQVRLVFDLPGDARHPALVIRQPGPLSPAVRIPL